jgi:hypothetical protein
VDLKRSQELMADLLALYKEASISKGRGHHEKNHTNDHHHHHHAPTTNHPNTETDVKRDSDPLFGGR